MQGAQVITIVAIRLDGGGEPQHIAHVRWVASASSGLTSVAGLVAWMAADAGRRAVVAGEPEVALEVVQAREGPAYLRVAGAADSSALLGLPRF